MPNREEIEKALQTIKNTCEQQDMCLTCPLRVVGEGTDPTYSCALNNYDTPAEWKLKTQEEHWRAFD